MMMDSRLLFFFISGTSSDLVGGFLTEQTCRLDAQNDDQDHERERVGERGVADTLDQLFAQTDDERADDRTRDLSLIHI